MLYNLKVFGHVNMQNLKGKYAIYRHAVKQCVCMTRQSHIFVFTVCEFVTQESRYNAPQQHQRYRSK